MVLNRKLLRFRMEMADGRHSVTAERQTQRFILNFLKLLDRRRRIERICDRCSIVKQGADERLVGKDKAFLVLTEVSVGQGSKDIETRRSPPRNRICVCCEGK